MTGTSQTGTACNGATNLASGYHAWADPLSTSTGTRYFFTNTTGTISEAHRLDRLCRQRHRVALERRRDSVDQLNRTRPDGYSPFRNSRFVMEGRIFR